MTQITAKRIKYNTDMSVKETEMLSINAEIGDRVQFVDNSFLDKCAANTTPYRSNVWPAGWNGRNSPPVICGTVLRTDSVQEVVDMTGGLGPRTIEMPIVVLGDDDSVIYCNAVHIINLSRPVEDEPIEGDYCPEPEYQQ